MLVTRVLGDCPGCKNKDCFGNVAVNEDHILRGCAYCKYHVHIPLPKLRKKVIYLDQFFFSHAFRGKDARFVTAVERVKRMTHLQLLVSPYSSIHEDETHQWSGHQELMDFIKDTARGIEFEKDYRIERTQVLKAFDAFLSQRTSNFLLESSDAIRGELNRWDGYFRIDVGGYSRDIELKRTLKAQSVQTLVGIFDEWQISTQTFSQDVGLELRDAGKLYLQSYITMVRRIANGELNALIDSPIMATIVEQMLHYLPNDMPRPEALQRCVEFFQSEHFSQIPNEWISARIFANLKDMVKRGAYANRDEALKRLSGFFDDVKHISMYAPYCDAFVMDTPMADLVRRPTLELDKRYGVKIFSLNNWDALLNWLNDLEANMSLEHKDAIAAAYG